LALTYLKLGNLARATDYAHQAATEAKRLGDVRSQAGISETQAKIALAEGRHQAALDLASEAIRLGANGAAPDATLEALVTMARAEGARGGQAAAIAAFEQAADQVRSGPSVARRREVLAEFAEFLMSAGDEKRALDLYREAVSP
jgi:tetratricopeptide (TPR) repeat protein